MMPLRAIVFLLVACWLQSAGAAVVNIQVVGLFKDAAVLRIDGKQQLLKVGKRSPEGILLISANTQFAVIDIDGRRQQLSLSSHISSQYNVVEQREVAIPRNSINQYLTSVVINGRRQQAIVDTGANVVAMSSTHARQLGIDYRAGEPSRVATASGVAQAHRVVLRSVQLGEITVSGVSAVVIDGHYPEHILLGMSFLQHLDMREENGTLYLNAKF